MRAMNARIMSLLDTIVQGVASAAFAGAVGFAVETTSWDNGYAVGAGLLAYAACFLFLKRLVTPEVRMKVPVFDLREFEPFELDELLLTEAVHHELVLTEADRVESELVLRDSDRVESRGGIASEPLVLDDVVTSVGAESRVVRLFDRKAMAGAEQRRASVGQSPYHPLGEGAGDASQALSEALAELRRSLR